MARQSPRIYFLFFLFFIGYILFANYLQRSDGYSITISFIVLFIVYWMAIRTDRNEEINFWISAAILFRLCFMVSIPSLSDDFYRFIWDGQLLSQGHHPFAHVPRYYIENDILTTDAQRVLFNHLNSPDYFTIYPPINQFIFYLSVKISGNSILQSVVMMRIFIITAEVGSILIIKKLLQQYHQLKKNILVYALNPLVIIELTGNLHFEALMIFFLLLSFWLVTKSKLLASAVSFSLAICSKLLPIILLPLLLARLGWKKSLLYYLAVFITCLLLFLPLLNTEIISGFRESIGYYFKKFEFNASIYYLVREWGFWNYGYNIIQTVGWKLGAWCAASILLFTLFDAYLNKSIVNSQQPTANSRQSTVDRRLFTSCLFIFTIYFAFATVVHPWYISTLLAFSIFTRFRFVILWTGIIFLTYLGYTSTGFTENLWLTAFEYATVFGYLAYELIWKREKQ
jgi:hypothetical protein